MNFENEVFGLARIHISEVRINEGLLYLISKVKEISFSFYVFHKLYPFVLVVKV